MREQYECAECGERVVDTGHGMWTHAIVSINRDHQPVLVIPAQRRENERKARIARWVERIEDR